MPVSQHLLLAPLEGPLGPSTNTPRIKTRSMCVDPFYFSNEVWLEKWCAFHCSCTSRLKIIIQCEIATKSPAFVSALQYIFISVEALNSGRVFKYLLSLSLSPTQWAPSVTEPLTVQTNTSPSCSVSIKTACCGWRDSRGLQKMQSWRQIIIIRHSKQSDTLQRAPQVFHFHTCSWREITRNVEMIVISGARGRKQSSPRSCADLIMSFLKASTSHSENHDGGLWTFYSLQLCYYLTVDGYSSLSPSFNLHLKFEIITAVGQVCADVSEHRCRCGVSGVARFSIMSCV